MVPALWFSGLSLKDFGFGVYGCLDVRYLNRGLAWLKHRSLKTDGRPSREPVLALGLPAILVLGFREPIIPCC